MRKVVATLVAAVVALLLVACTPAEGTHFNQLNDYRKSQGVPALNWEEAAYQKARTQSELMASQNKLSHSILSQGVPGDWRALGENVAMGPSLTAAFDALVKSAPHRANMLNPKFNRAAIGVVERDGYFWITEVFIG